ncbi:AP2 domain protein [Theileria parva strain Muguga]|uniref:AP2/ERF domain-containing protein n=1 Tax=Theileria parva TaxID=5875 RepID=Q4N1X5_THEPA|nr:AP2 domain protein [Theileria parva strain Muguga]EAN31954.1 AP2 domain protein [Theileria parva strain Muguga]|eukprot:XP_764237.1 hypothetical protein [Theileria parva strain Muguga]
MDNVLNTQDYQCVLQNQNYDSLKGHNYENFMNSDQFLEENCYQEYPNVNKGEEYTPSNGYENYKNSNSSNIDENIMTNYKMDEEFNNYKLDNYNLDYNYGYNGVNGYTLPDNTKCVNGNDKMVANGNIQGYSNKNYVDSVSTTCGVDSANKDACYYDQYQYYMNYPVMYNMPNIQNPNTMVTISNLPDNMINETKLMNLKDADKFSNSTIENDSVSDVDCTDGTNPPANRSDPIYTAISGLKWKSKSKKWVVRWDNPITNRRVYKYFSGTRYGFLGAHKRAKYYLEFLNASVGKIQNTSPGNPFCRRTEGPPKGKQNKSLIRKMYFSAQNDNAYQHEYMNSMMNCNHSGQNLINYSQTLESQMGYNGEFMPRNGQNFNRSSEVMDFNNKVGSTMDNPWFFNQHQMFNNY